MPCFRPSSVAQRPTFQSRLHKVSHSKESADATSRDHPRERQAAHLERKFISANGSCTREQPIRQLHLFFVQANIDKLLLETGQCVGRFEKKVLLVLGFQSIRAPVATSDPHRAVGVARFYYSRCFAIELPNGERFRALHCVGTRLLGQCRLALLCLQMPTVSVIGGAGALGRNHRRA